MKLIKIYHLFQKSFNFILKNRFFQHQYQKQEKMFVFTLWLVSHSVCIHIQYFFGVMTNKLQRQPLEVFCKKGILKNFTKFIVKHRCQNLFFNKVAGLRSATIFKIRPWHRCFPVNFAKFLRTSFV